MCSIVLWVGLGLLVSLLVAGVVAPQIHLWCFSSPWEQWDSWRGLSLDFLPLRSGRLWWKHPVSWDSLSWSWGQALLRKIEYRCSSKVTIFVFAVAARGESVSLCGPHSERLAELLRRTFQSVSSRLLAGVREFLRFVLYQASSSSSLNSSISLPGSGSHVGSPFSFALLNY